MDRFLAGAGAEQVLLNYDIDGDPVDAGNGDATVVVTDSAGVEVPQSPLAGVVGSTGEYTLTIPPTMLTLDNYTASWTMADDSPRTTEFELVGSFLFTIAALRARYTELVEDKYSADRVREVRNEVEDTFTRCARVSFTRRGYRESRSGADDATLFLTLRRLHRLISASIDTEALTVDELADVIVGDQWLQRKTGVWTTGVSNVDVLYEHGLASPPGPVVAKGLAYARHLLVRSAFDEANRAVLQSTELGTFRMSVAGGRHFTGLPDVDAVLEQWGRRHGAVG